MPALIAKATIIISTGETPQRLAAAGRVAVAVMRLPSRVWLSRKYSPATTTIVMPSTQSVCGGMKTVPSWMDVSPVNGGRPRP